MTTLLYHPAGARSAPALAREMNATPIRHRHAGRVPAGTTLIRWGSAAATPPVPREINSRRSLSAYSNRLGQLTLLRNGEVRVPDFGVEPIEGAGAVLARDFTRGRQNSHGRGITIYQPGEEPQHHDMYMELIPKHRQFRVHVINHPDGAVTRTREVVHTTELLLDPDGNIEAFTRNDEGPRLVPIWNLKSNFTYRVVQGQRPRGVIPAAIAAVNALTLDFGAVDIITNRDGTPYVLEVNTAPGLCDLTRQWYARNLHRIIHE